MTKPSLLISAVFAAVLLAGSSASIEAQEEKIKIRTEKDFPDGLKEFSGPLIALDRIRSLEAFPPEGDVDGRFNKPGPQNIYRWNWLTAKRRNLVYYDQLCHDAAGFEKQFHLVYAASMHPQKKFYIDDGLKFGEFIDRRLVIRKSWYYTARGHRWQWEKEGPDRPLNYRLFMSTHKFLGCTTDQLFLTLAWIDLVISECMPAMFLPFELAFALMS